MKNPKNILFIVCVVIICAISMSLVPRPHKFLPAFLNAGTTVVVGWWIHSAVRRRGELERVPIDYLANLYRRIDELTTVCLEATEQDSERLVEFRRLSNEIHWLCIIAGRMQPNLGRVGDKLGSHYVDFKRYLTESDSPDLVWASKASQELRLTALNLQWKMCQHILDRKTATDLFEH